MKERTTEQLLRRCYLEISMLGGPKGNGFILDAALVRSALAEARTIGTREGMNAAAEYMDCWNREASTKFRLGDLLRCKFNLWQRAKPRLNQHR